MRNRGHDLGTRTRRSPTTNRRCKRNDTEYPSLTTPGVTTDEATQALGIARETIDAVKKLLDSGRLDEFH